MTEASERDEARGQLVNLVCRLRREQAPEAAIVDSLLSNRMLVLRALGGPVTETAGSKMHCPECGSTNVICTSTRKAHTHECHDCGYSLVAAGARRG